MLEGGQHQIIAPVLRAPSGAQKAKGGLPGAPLRRQQNQATPVAQQGRVQNGGGAGEGLEPGGDPFFQRRRQLLSRAYPAHRLALVVEDKFFAGNPGAQREHGDIEWFIGGLAEPDRPDLRERFNQERVPVVGETGVGPYVPDPGLHGRGCRAEPRV